jgi:hypothetical protein
MTTPPSAGPATAALCITIALRLIALGRCSRGTSVGRSDCRAGRSKALTAPPSAASAYRGHSEESPFHVAAASATATRAAPDCVTIIKRRRLCASAITPAIIENVMIGTTRTRPTMPSASALLSGGASSDTCQSSAAFCMYEPVKESRRPTQSRRKLRCWNATSDGWEKFN